MLPIDETQAPEPATQSTLKSTDSFFCIKANYLKKKIDLKKMLNFKYIFSDCKERNSP